MTKRKFITRTEVNSLLDATKQGRYPNRDYCLLLMSFLHGLRVSELTHITMSDIDLVQKVIFIRRLKGGLSTVQPIIPEEFNAIEKWLVERDSWKTAGSDCLFISQKGSQISRYQIYRLFEQYGKIAGLPVKLHPHMLRHACGYALADLGRDTRLIQDYLGHRNIAHTVIYTASNEKRFSGIWSNQ
ncbi:tyrosine-type DNA invertase [Providencia hangzhouensis]|uniref:DNA recombinase n=1 Tax=Providencia rettgeri TaxID=587 RepID=A0A2A5Q9E8_PRORE|nr:MULTISPECIES: tyrosine-type DNA invertase [Providencia]MRF65547.1 tyrosine-type recombinase/integrase [Escherichia coli]EFE52653.1 site-specific recombinase, phage integrase family [Providencia rettgeri DSM 1131]MBG5893626.1 tyrosine-type recombinase/integrase [Providencia rettgeri]MBG5926544.1 tyrosine-type recombinase/integrase [Providencia rettgeri]MBI6189697.1 tyrosine-type recombinase/integrase [Providencia rettgeri]